MNISTSVTTHTISKPSQLGPVMTGMGSYNAYDTLDIAAWKPFYPQVFVVSSVPFDEDGAVRVIRSKGPVPTLVEGVRSYILRIPGNAPVCFTNIGTRFTENVSKITAFSDENRMERTWAAFAGHPGEAPCAFWVTGTALGYMMNDIPSSLPILGNDWLVWVDGWLKSHLFSHRYFDASQFRVLEAIPSVLSPSGAPGDTQTPIEPQIALNPTETPLPAKRKGGRPKKNGTGTVQ